jgi:hypothetical protein
MITQLVQGETRTLVNVETEEQGIATVEIRHVRDPIRGREVIEVTVVLDAEDVDVKTAVIDR